MKTRFAQQSLDFMNFCLKICHSNYRVHGWNILMLFMNEKIPERREQAKCSYE